MKESKQVIERLMVNVFVVRSICIHGYCKVCFYHVCVFVRQVYRIILFITSAPTN